MSSTEVPDHALEVRGLTKSYGAVVAVDDVTTSIGAGERRAVIGPNGAGKSTLFALVAGTMRPTSGRVLLEGRDITRLRDHQRARKGLVKTFQHSSVFTAMTLMDNVLLATQRTNGGSAKPFGRSSRLAIDSARDALEQVGLSERADSVAGMLSHGERRQLEIALALGSAPHVLLLDEPTAGMSASETERFVDLLKSLPRDITVLIIEHDLQVVFSVADRVSVMHLGAILEEGTPAQIRESELVQQTYLGAGPESADTGVSA